VLGAVGFSCPNGTPRPNLGVVSTKTGVKATLAAGPAAPTSAGTSRNALSLRAKLKPAHQPLDEFSPKRPAPALVFTATALLGQDDDYDLKPVARWAGYSIPPDRLRFHRVSGTDSDARHLRHPGDWCLKRQVCSMHLPFG
jgi:hypothetical protein